VKVFAKAYKTYGGAYNAMVIRQLDTKHRKWVWSIKLKGEGRYHIVRYSRAEHQRERAIAFALEALGVDD
jgi:hypothetical protein